MQRGLLIVHLIFLITSINALGQDCSGEKINSSTLAIQKVCFEYSYLEDTINKNYRTTCLVSEKGKIMYTITFDLFINNDSIAVFLKEKDNDISKIFSLRYDRNFFPVIISERSENDKIYCYDNLVNDTDTYKILFTIPFSSEPYVTLNKFQSINDSSINYNLFPIKPYKRKHQDTCIKYWLHREETFLRSVKKVNE